MKKSKTPTFLLDLPFVLQDPKEGNAGWLVWGKERFVALIDWHDPVVHHGMAHRIKFVRLLRRKASSDRAEGAAAIEDVHQRARAGEALPQSMGMPRAGARLPTSLLSDQQELVYRHGRVEALARSSEPLAFQTGESQYIILTSKALMKENGKRYERPIRATTAYTGSYPKNYRVR